MTYEPNLRLLGGMSKGYDNAGDLTRTADVLNNFTNLSYDGDHNLVSKARPARIQLISG